METVGDSAWKKGIGSFRRWDRKQDQSVGEYFADILVEGALVVELKGVDRLTNEPMAPCWNSLRASGMSLGLLVNFQKPTVAWKRVVLNF